MEQKNENVLATIKFDADKVLPKMKRCLDKKSGVHYCNNPAIEIRTGIMLATEGHILVAHKLKGYSYERGENVPVGVNDVQYIPYDVLTMKGVITVKVKQENYQTVIVAEDSNGNSGMIATTANYPNWRMAVPTWVGAPINVDAKTWDVTAKTVLAKNDYDTDYLSLTAEPKAKSLSIGYWDCFDEKACGTENVSVEPMPYKIVAVFFGKLFRSMMAFAPKTMQFRDGNTAVLFTNDDTLGILMPIKFDDSPVTVPDKELVDFQLTDWIGERQTAKVVKPVKAEPTMADRLRAALLKMQEKQAA